MYELYHYGVKGMKWGIRRYQNKDGSLTAAGKKRAKQEYRSDNKTAFELGKTATVYGHAAARSMKRTVKIENKLDKQYEKDPSGSNRKTKKLLGKWLASAKTTQQLTESYAKSREAAEKHCKSLMDKYGKEAVSSIKYRDVKIPKSDYGPSTFKTMNERTNKLSDYAKAGAATVGSRAFSTVMGLPVSAVFVPETTFVRAANLEGTTYKKNRSSQSSHTYVVRA